jgi:hypothetical protein
MDPLETSSFCEKDRQVEAGIVLEMSELRA